MQISLWRLVPLSDAKELPGVLVSGSSIILYAYEIELMHLKVNSMKIKKVSHLILTFSLVAFNGSLSVENYALYWHNQRISAIMNAKKENFHG